MSTGNPGLDAMLAGGLMPKRPYLVVGPAGTGKSRLGLQFLCEGIRRGERVLLVTIEEPPNEARLNHRGLAPELSAVEVFDAIPDVMRYERAPFKDIASVRAATPFRDVPVDIRRTPELSSVEVTITALEQMLRSEVLRRNYTRVVIDSLTALQYFCMKGFDPVAGAQTFLRFLSDLGTTTLLTVESPLEDADTPERMLARGEIRLFRWELDDVTVRAVGVEKFRGSTHDSRLHPYRIGPRGLDINLDVTISRDTRQIVFAPSAVAASAYHGTGLSLEPLAEAVRDLVLVGAEVGPLRTAFQSAVDATTRGDVGAAERHLSHASALAVGLAEEVRARGESSVRPDPAADAAYQRILARAAAARSALPPARVSAPTALSEELARVLTLIPPLPPPGAVSPPATPPAAPPPPPRPAAATPSPPPPPPAAAPEAQTRPVPPLPSQEESRPPSPAPSPPLMEAIPPDPPASIVAEPPAPAPAVKSSAAVPAAKSVDDRPATTAAGSPLIGGVAPKATEVRGPANPPLPSARDHVEPPPLPSSSVAPTSPPTNAVVTPAAPASASRPGPGVPLGPPAPPVPPSGDEPTTPPPESLPSTAKPKRRRKSPSGSSRKKAVADATAPLSSPEAPAARSPEPIPPAASEVALPTSVDRPTPIAELSTAPIPAVAPGPAPPIGGDQPPPPKPRRKPARKRKAPPVVAALPGTPPPDADPPPGESPPPPAATPSADPVPAEPPPEPG